MILDGHLEGIPLMRSATVLSGTNRSVSQMLTRGKRLRRKNSNPSRADNPVSTTREGCGGLAFLYRLSMQTKDRLIQYGISEAIANKAVKAGLTASKIRQLSLVDLRTKFGLTMPEAKEVKRCIARQPIDGSTLDMLLDRNNHTCCVCKGTKGGGIIVHHIQPYEVGQNNRYQNLAVLCPNDHDRAHTSGGLSMSLTEEQIHKAKTSWEKQVELTNVQVAARAINVVNEAIDYVNVTRIEEMCGSRFGKIPDTTIASYLKSIRILAQNGRFDEAYVRKNLSNGGYLFDYINSSEAEHYRQLLEKLSQHIRFEDLSEAARSGIRRLKSLEGEYAYFIGGVRSKRPKMPITVSSPPIVFTHQTKKVRIRWDGDPNYLQSTSAISRQGRLNNYIVYCLVRTVEKAADKIVDVTASPLLIAQPKKRVDRTPPIHWRNHWDGENNLDEEDD